MVINYPEKVEYQIYEMHAVEADKGIKKLFSVDNFSKLQSIMYSRKVIQGAYLFWEGDRTGKLYYIRSGRIHLRKSTEDGKELILSVLQKGDLIGEINGNEDMFNFSAEVMEDAEIGVIQEKDLEILLYRYGDFAVQFMKWMSLTHRTTQSKFRDLLLFGKPGALASTLIRLSNTCGVLCKEGIRLNIRMTNTELADLIGTSREGVNRMLSSMKDEGTISMANGQITIRRIEDLRLICKCPTDTPCPREICRL